MRRPARRSPLRRSAPAPRRLSRRPVLALALALGLAVLAAAPAPLAAAPYENGARVQFTGLVTDREGKPLSGVNVVLEASRSYFSLRQLRRAEKDARRVSGTTNAQGEYALAWTWDNYYNRFELMTGVPVRRGKEESLQVLEREDVTERTLAGTPVVSAIVVRDRAFVDRLRQFVASIQSADQRRVYDEMGTPDDVKQVNYTGTRTTPSTVEVSWWYFDTGKVYRFRNGHLEQVSHFDPVHPF
ncbi:MAG TPA: hypothetical protein VHR45_20700 [Thermoanaerobaculia bacterium]|nr:hypothetical protein [Thermoanaerobaculia bacterium]